MSQRKEFVKLALSEGANRARLCERFGVSRKTGYKWLVRYQREGEPGFADRSRRPRSSPGVTPPVLADAVVRLREAHPAWGGRKLRARLMALAYTPVPAASTIIAILQHHGLIDPEASAQARALQRFEGQALWQMDFKGHVATNQGRCHPLTVLDDHSRYAVGLEACADERGATVQQRLTLIFRRYGLPREILVTTARSGARTGSIPTRR